MSVRNKNSNGNTRDVLAAQRAQLALKLKAQGKSWDEIATAAGYASRGAAHNAVQRELARTITHDVEQMRREEANILMQLHERCMESVFDEHNKGYLFAVDRVLAIRERWAKLFGLDMQKDANVAANQVIVRELPPHYMGITEAKSQ